MLSSSNLLETLLKENSELTERVTSLSQERATLKHRLTYLERELRRTEDELTKVTAETENRPIYDVTSNSKVSRSRVHLHNFVVREMNYIALQQLSMKRFYGINYHSRFYTGTPP